MRADLWDQVVADRKAIREGLMGSLPAAGRVDRDRLRWILAADRGQLYRSEGARNSAEWLAAIFHISKWKAQRWVAAAHVLERLPNIAAALEAGSLSLDKTVELTRFATPETEKKLVAWARRVTVGCIRQRGDEAAQASKEEVQNAHHNRELTWWWNDHSLFFQGSLPAEQGAALIEAVDRLAQELPEDPDSPQAVFESDEAPSMEQRRADALVLLATSSEVTTTKPTVVVHVPVSALTEDEGNGVTERGPVLDPELVRMLSCDSRLQTIIEDPSGHPLGVGRETETPPRWLRRMVLGRDGHTCTFPGCGMKRFLHLHHIEHWSKGGTTDYWNLVTVCQVHHSLVHKMGWSVALEDGHASWHRPMGRRYEPGPAPPDPAEFPTKYRPTLGEAAGYGGMYYLSRLLARRPATKPSADPDLSS